MARRGALKRFGADTATGLDEPERTFLHHHYDYVVCAGEASPRAVVAALRTPLERVLPLGVPRTDFFFDPAAIERRARRGSSPRTRPSRAGGRAVRADVPRPGPREGAARPGSMPRALRGGAPADATSSSSRPTRTSTRPVCRRPATTSSSIRRADINDWLAAADVLVTDYSSSIFEWALLRRPLVLLADDLEAYERDPGLYLDSRTEMIGRSGARHRRASAAAIAARRPSTRPRTTRSSPATWARATGTASDRFVERFMPARGGTARTGLTGSAHSTPMATKIILDVDTGTDDAVALMTAALSPDLELVGATVVNGNTVLDSCVENTLRVFEWIGMPEVPVFRGMSRPIARHAGRSTTRRPGSTATSSTCPRRRSRRSRSTRSTG